MFRTFWLRVTTPFRRFRARRTLLLENLVLRQQLAVLKRKHPRPKLRAETSERIFLLSIDEFPRNFDKLRRLSYLSSSFDDCGTSFLREE